jgi:hypothetical protein
MENLNTLTGRYAARRAWDANTMSLSSIEKAQEILDYNKHLSLKDGLKITHTWFV